MKALPNFALTRQSIVSCAAAVLVLAGIGAAITMPQREDPEYRILTCAISTVWPGANAADVEQIVTSPIEDAIAQLGEVDHVRSTSSMGRSVVFVDLKSSVGDVEAAWQKVRDETAVAAVNLPTGVREPDINTNFGDTAAMLLALRPKKSQATPIGSSRAMPNRQLETVADALVDQLRMIDEVARIDLYGVQDEAIYIEIDPYRLSQVDVTISQLENTLQARNIIAPGGRITTSKLELGVKPSGELNTVKQLEQVVVAENDDGVPIFLRDVGFTVSRRYTEPPRSIVRYSYFGKASWSSADGCIVLSVLMADGAQVTQLGDRVRELLETENGGLLRDCEIDIVTDQPSSVEQKIGDFAINLAQAILIVVGVAWILVGFRIAFVMATAIPIIVLASLGIVSLFPITIDQISIAAFIIALGLLVDAVIEVCDNALRLMEEGKSRYEAALEGSAEIAFPVLIATLTSVFAFLPMVFSLTGSRREYLFSLPVVVSVTLIVSWFLAMTVTTLMAYLLMRHSDAKTPASRVSLIIGTIFRRVRKSQSQRTNDSSRSGLYERLLHGCLAAKWFVVTGAVALFIAAAMLVVGGKIGTQFFPLADREQFIVEVHLPVGSPLSLTNEVCVRLEQDLYAASGSGEQQRIRDIVTYVGSGGPRFFLSLTPEQPKANYALLLVTTKEKAFVSPLVEEVRKLATNIAEARVVPRRLEQGPPVDAPIGIRVTGPKFADAGTLRSVAEELRSELRAIDGVWDVQDDWGNDTYQLDVDIDENRANLAGVTNASIARTLNASFSGHLLTSYREEDHLVPIYLRLPPSEEPTSLGFYDRDLNEVKRAYVEGAYGKVPLQSVATVKPDYGLAQIRRRDLARTIEVRARVDAGLLANSVLREAMPGVGDIRATLPPGYRIEIGGEQEKTAESQSEMATSFLISFALIVLCLVVQYNGYIKPMMILVTLPLAATGSLIGLWLLNQPLGFMAMLGLLSLAGVVLNDAIVLVEFVEMKLKNLSANETSAEENKSYAGLSKIDFRQQVVAGAKLRVLPIWLTTLTTAGGLIPLAMSGGPLFEPMAAVIIFGLLYATSMTLFVLPSLYAILVESFGFCPITATGPDH